MTFAEKLQMLRAQNGYSQEMLAEQLNVSRQAVSKWELGGTLPDTDKAVAISHFFEVSLDYLLKDTIQINMSDSLDRAIIRFLSAAKDMDEISDELIEIMRDGTIDAAERVRILEIMDTLDEISVIIDEIKHKMSEE